MAMCMNNFVLVVLVMVLIGCGTTAKEIQMKSQGEKAGVFVEVKDGEPIPQGFVNLTIKATVKTHLEGYYVFESKKSPHGKSTYLFLVNIDGQSSTWQVKGVKETVPLYDKDGKTNRDPDAGEGIKYVLEKRLRLNAGTHKIFIGLPADDYFKKIEISLTEGDVYTLEFRPVYKYKTRPTRIPRFEQGIKEFEVFLNGVRVP